MLHDTKTCVTRIAVLCAAVVSLISCNAREGPSSWPPIADEAHTKFVRNSAELRKLHQLVERSGYSNVSIYNEEEVRGYKSADDPAQGEVPSNSELLLNLMTETSIHVVDHNDDVYFYVTGMQFVDGNKFQSIAYVFDTNDPLNVCAEKFKEVPCGACEIYRKHDWTIEYIWASGEFVEDYYQSVDVAINSDSSTIENRVDSFRQFQDVQNECILDGLEEMEFENASD